MKKFFTILFLLIFTNLSFAADSGSNNNGSKSLRCPGEFANPISDICWSCIFLSAWEECHCGKVDKKIIVIHRNCSVVVRSQESI